MFSLGLTGGNKHFYGDVIHVAFLATVTAGIMLTISLRPDSKEWPFLYYFDELGQILFWLENCYITMAAGLPVAMSPGVGHILQSR